MTNLRLYLSIFGEKFDLDKLSRITKLTPTDSWVKGEKRKIIRPETCWIYDFGGVVETLFLDDLTIKFKALFSSNASQIADFIKENQLESKLVVVPKIYDENTPSLYFDRETIRLISLFNGIIDIDSYVCYTETDDFFENMMELEQRKLEEFEKFSKLSNAQKIEYLNQKLDWENYNKIKYEFTLEILDSYHIDDEVLREIWKDWLKITLYQEFMIRDGIVCFFYRNPELKSQMIAELNRLIETNPIKVTSSNSKELITDDKPIYIAGLVLWDLGYKKALQDFIKKYKKECDLYFDEDDYRKINELEEECVMS